MTSWPSYFVESIPAGLCLDWFIPGVEGSKDPANSSFISPMPEPWESPGPSRAIWVQSPNYDRRPLACAVDTVVLHATVFESLHQTVRHFCRQASRVSAHYVIGKEGGIVQCVSVFRRAWHAGESRDAEGRPKVNDFSLGIELVNRNDGFDPFPQEQTDALCALIRSLSRRFPLTRVTSHACIALPPGRKTDPKGFPWQTLAASGLKVVG